MKNKKIKEKVWEFFKPTKRKVKAYVILMAILFILSIFIYVFFGKMSCFRLPCEDGSYGHFRTYAFCSPCEEPALIDDVIGYATHYFFTPFTMLFDIEFLGVILIPFFLLNMFIWYSLICFYIKLKEKITKRIKK